MKKLTKITSVLLLLVMLLSIVACGGDTPAVTDGKDTDPKGTDPVVTDAPTTTIPAEPLEIPSDATFDGHTFLWLTGGNVAYNDFDFDDTASTVLDVAQYQRKVTVEELLDIVIESEKAQSGSSSGSGPSAQKIKQAVSANETIYDAANVGGYDVAALAIANQLYDLNSTTYVDLEKSWWDQNANEDLNVNGLMFFTFGEISGCRSTSTFVVFYNKALGETKNLTAPYDVVEEGKWTLDYFAEMCRAVSEDLDGNDTLDYNDRFGLYCWDDAMMGIMASTGTRVCTINDDGVMELTLYSEVSEDAFNKFTNLIYDKNYCLAYQRYTSQFSVRDAWAADKALFWATSNVNTASMVEMESDFSILPYPKLNDNQDRYYTTVAPYNSQFICMPLVQENEERTSTIVEALAYYGQKVLTPALYEKTVKGSQIRDEDTARMLDIIYDSYMFDVGYYYQVGGYNSGLMNLFRSYDLGFASMFNRTKKAAEVKLKTINNNFADVLSDWQE